jgi:hypothetical protein
VIRSLAKPVRIVDYEFRQWVRRKPCLLADRVPCECDSFIRINNGHFATDPCHLHGRGAGGSDPENIVALCRKHHRELDEVLRVKGFDQKYGVSLKAVAKELWAEFKRETA